MYVRGNQHQMTALERAAYDYYDSYETHEELVARVGERRAKAIVAICSELHELEESYHPQLIDECYL